MFELLKHINKNPPLKTKSTDVGAHNGDRLVICGVDDDDYEDRMTNPKSWRRKKINIFPMLRVL